MRDVGRFGAGWEAAGNGERRVLRQQVAQGKGAGKPQVGVTIVFSNSRRGEVRKWIFDYELWL